MCQVLLVIAAPVSQLSLLTDHSKTETVRVLCVFVQEAGEELPAQEKGRR